MQNIEQQTKHFFDFVSNATSPYHVVQTSIDFLKEKGFTELDFTTNWSLTPNTAYYTKPYGTTLFAFRTPENITTDSIFRICASHTDHPGFRIKPNPDIQEKGYWKLNVETYGGVILNTWLDRPLSIAGKVSLKSNTVFYPDCRLMDSKRPLLTIPNLAIHMNRSINSGVELNKQTDMLPLFSVFEPKMQPESFVQFLANELQVSAEDILDFDLYIYNTENGCTFGLNQTLCSCPRLDNLTSVYSSLAGITSCTGTENDFQIALLYDNEEIGSRTKQGADSAITQILLEKISSSFGITKENCQNMLLKSFMVSADVAHALHPNHPEKNDVTNFVRLDGGVAIKMSANQKYATDTETIAVLQQLCVSNDIPFQKFVNRSDIPGGSTLGTITSSWLPMQTVDIGVPILAMHSARETASIRDILSLQRLIEAFYSCPRSTI